MNREMTTAQVAVKKEILGIQIFVLRLCDSMEQPPAHDTNIYENRNLPYDRVARSYIGLTLSASSVDTVSYPLESCLTYGGLAQFLRPTTPAIPTA